MSEWLCGSGDSGVTTIILSKIGLLKYLGLRMGKEAHITIPVLTGALETPRLTPIPLGKKEVEKKKRKEKEVFILAGLGVISRASRIPLCSFMMCISNITT